MAQPAEDAKMLLSRRHNQCSQPRDAILQPVPSHDASRVFQHARGSIKIYLALFLAPKVIPAPTPINRNLPFVKPLSPKAKTLCVINERPTTQASKRKSLEENMPTAEAPRPQAPMEASAPPAPGTIVKQQPVSVAGQPTLPGWITRRETLEKNTNMASSRKLNLAQSPRTR